MLARKGGEGRRGRKTAQIHVTQHILGQREVLARGEKEGGFCSPPFTHDSCNLWCFRRPVRDDDLYPYGYHYTAICLEVSPVGLPRQA
jgi:hypothetical protein